MQAAVGASPRRQDIAQQTLQWWDRQIALLAQRASASGRVADLEAQHAALQQQLADLQNTATAGCARLPRVPPLLSEATLVVLPGSKRQGGKHRESRNVAVYGVLAHLLRLVRARCLA